MKARLLVPLMAIAAVAASEIPRGELQTVAFTEPSPLSHNGALIERLIAPFNAADLAGRTSARTLAAQPLNLGEERFSLFVPSREPAGGYALMVYISPWDDTRLPRGWTGVLEREGVIFVSAANSGNGAPVVTRRVPLALDAATNVARRYRIDQDRVWIAGFSGGARVAERVALAYPDVFTGALLDGGSDEIGSADLPLPTRERFEQFLDRTAIVISAGSEDPINVSAARNTAGSLKRHCHERVAVKVRNRAGHEPMDAKALTMALADLSAPRGQTGAEIASCRAALYSRIEGELTRAEALVARDGRDAAAALQSIDLRYGRLAAPRALELRARLR